VNAQPNSVVVRLRNLKDSVEIGKPFLVSLTVLHSSTEEVLFPDTNVNFGLLTCKKKEWFPTITSGMISVDSAIYSLITFSPAPIYSLSVPVYLLNEGDSLPVNSNTIHVNFKSSLAGPLKGLQADTEYQFVKDLLDYPVLILIVLLIVVVGGIGYILFGRGITLYVRQLLLYRRQRIFLSIFNRLVDQGLREMNPARVEEILLLWKRHLQRLSNVNYSTFTTRDFSKAIKNEQLIEVLRRIDKVVYAGDVDEIREDLFEVLRDEAHVFYLRRREAQRYGS